MKSIFRYPGGKSRLVDKILSLAPTNYNRYFEPFVGGGSVFFSVPCDKERYINDLDTDLISVYEALKNRPLDFILKCCNIKAPIDGEELTSTKPGGRKIYNKRLKETFDELQKSDDSALRYFFTNRTVWAGRVNYDLPSRMYFSNPGGWNIINSNKLKLAAKCLKDVNISNKSYQDFLDQDFNSKDFLYIDPPYVINEKLSCESQLYKFIFRKEDHILLHKILCQIKGKIILSYDETQEILNLYKNWNIIKVPHKSVGTTKSKKDTKIELLIKNF